MKRNIALWQIVGFFVTCILGTLLHFLYDWTGGSILAAPFSGVNESTWEHMKLLYFPLLIFALIESRYFKEYDGFWWIKLIGTFVGLCMIPVLFYTYNGVFGKSPDWVNITIFFISAAVAFFIETLLFKKGNIRGNADWLPILMIILIGAAFVVFTFKTPQIPVFRDPITGTYGVEK